jgi:hypothetical protein
MLEHLEKWMIRPYQLHRRNDTNQLLDWNRRDFVQQCTLFAVLRHYYLCMQYIVLEELLKIGF